MDRLRRVRFVCRAAALPLLLLASACVDVRYFAPRENRNGTGPTGYPAAVYPLAKAEDPTAGELRIWSDGARGEDADSGRRVEVHVGFELENTGAAALELAAIRSEDDTLSLVRTDGAARAVPGGASRLQTWFLAPAAGSARDLAEFAIRYEVLADGEPILVQRTPFARWTPPDPRDYDPFFVTPPFGFGFAFGWGCR